MMIGSIDDCDRLNLDQVPGLGQRLHSHQGVGGLASRTTCAPAPEGVRDQRALP